MNNMMFLAKKGPFLCIFWNLEKNVQVLARNCFHSVAISWCVLIYTSQIILATPSWLLIVFLGFLWRKLQGFPRTLRETSYTYFVLPVLDYCCSILWQDPYHQTSIYKLEIISDSASIAGDARYVLNKPWRKTTRDTTWQYHSHAGNIKMATTAKTCLILATTV